MSINRQAWSKPQTVPIETFAKKKILRPIMIFPKQCACVSILKFSLILIRSTKIDRKACFFKLLNLTCGIQIKNHHTA